MHPSVPFKDGDAVTQHTSELALDLYFSCHFESLHFTWEFSNDTSKDYIQYYKLSAMIKETKCTHFVFSVCSMFSSVRYIFARGGCPYS